MDRILREQGLGGFVSQGGGVKAPYTGRSVAVIPDLDTPTSYDGLNRSLAIALGDALGRTKDIRVAGLDQVKEAMGKGGVNGKLSLSPNIKTLGDYLGVQAIVLTGIMPPEKGSNGAMILQVYDTFMGTKGQSLAGSPATGLNAAAATKFAQDNALRVGAEVVNTPWFGRVDFTKEGKVYLNLGQNAGLKVGDRLRVVAPGKEVVNPNTRTVLGYTSDETQGELKVTELLGNSGAVATALVNAAWSRGLGAVINSQGIMQSPVVREHAGIADDQVIMKSIALGWPDESFPANAVVSERKSVDEAAVFVGFDH